MGGVQDLGHLRGFQKSGVLLGGPYDEASLLGGLMFCPQIGKFQFAQHLTEVKGDWNRSTTFMDSIP